jgi:hypothetical protein
MMPSGTTGGTPQILLSRHLKQLKMPTVLREYEKVARECAEAGVDHPRYLLRLIELELIDRERCTVERRIRAGPDRGHFHVGTTTQPLARFYSATLACF